MSWEKCDRECFFPSFETGGGQINLDQQIGQAIRDLVSLPTTRSILEIGTWTGHGSTKCIVEGLKQKPADSYVFYSLEANTEKCALARGLYKDVPNVHILDEVILNGRQPDEYSIFPELLFNPTFQHWHDVDIQNMVGKKLFLERPELPAVFDIVLLDGGEFTTWYEYVALRDRCRILILDDTNVSKCRRIVQEIKSQPEKWQIILEGTERNGNLIAVRRDM